MQHQQDALMATISKGAATALVAAVLGCWAIAAAAQSDDPLPSWNDGPAKQAILELVDAVTTEGGADYVAPEDRIATFDQDGTLWVEHPVYAQVVFALDRVVALAPEHPEWKTTEPFKTVLSGDKAAMAKLTLRDLEEIVFATHAGMSVEAFAAIAEQWTSKARNPRWDRLYIDLVYQPMEEVLACCARTAFGPTSSPAAARPSCAPTPLRSTVSARPR